MRSIVQVTKEGDELLAVADDGTLWHGLLVLTNDEPSVIVEWTPLNGPPDGDYWVKHRPFWDRLEEKLRREAENKNSPD